MRVLRANYFGRSARANYWAATALAAQLRRLLDGANAAFRRHVVRDFKRYWLASPRPVSGETRERAEAAVGWLLGAQRVTPDDGVSFGWFPCDGDATAWRPSYPETTGYIITSLLDYAALFHDREARESALRMARWEVDTQMPSGAVQGGPVCPPDRQTPAAFNTGMVLDGWCSAYRESRDAAVFEAARRAADFLVSDLDENGYFRTNGAFVSSGEIKTYTCLCAWAMHRFADLSGEPRYALAAVRAVEAAIAQQQDNGWFAHNCLARSDAPLTHTIGYTLQGVLEVGVLARRDDFIAAVVKTVDRLLPQISNVGYLPGTFYSDWQPAGFSSCLTGSAQIAIVCYRLATLTGKPEYRASADRLVDYLKALQDVTTDVEGIKGALPGSFPIFGGYMRGGYPNWATKYLLDALMLQHISSLAPEASSARNAMTAALA